LVDAGVSLLRAQSSMLKNFRVIGVISNVLLVVDTATEGSFIIKVPISIVVGMHEIAAFVRFYLINGC